MKLTDIAAVEAPEHKVKDYLLSVTHPDGMHKARFFMAFGFSASDWEQLALALEALAGDNDLVAEAATEFGQKYRVEGELGCPDGRRPVVCSIWIVETGSSVAKLVTAYPG